MPVAVGFVGGMFGFGASAIAVGGAGAVAGWWAGSTIAGTLIGSLTIKLLTTVAVTALTQAMQPDPPQGGGITISTTVNGEDNPETIVLGRYATGGQVICPPYSHGESNRYLTHVIELCSAPGATLERVMIGEDWAEFGPTPHPDYGLPVLGDYEGHVWVKYHDGNQIAADPMLLDRYGSDPDRPWTADMVGAGICYAILTFYYDQENLPQVPRYRFELGGIPLYDIRRDSTAGGSGAHRLSDPATWEPSENPIVHAWNIMRGIRLPGADVYGGNITDLRALPQSVWMAAMNRCDAEIDIGEDETEPAYRAGLEIALNQPPAAALEELFKACSATIADLGYGWGVTVGSPGLPVYAIGEDDVVVSRTQQADPFPSLQETYNAISARFPDPRHHWETKEAPQRTNAEWEEADAFGRRMANLSLPAVPYHRQVQRLMRAWIMDERRFRRHVISLPPDAAHVELIDTVTWSDARNGYDGKVFSPYEFLEDPRTAIRQFSIRERDQNDYSWVPGFELPSPPSPPSPVTRPPEQVSGFDAEGVVLADPDGRSRRVGARLFWNGAIAARGLRWQIRLAGGGAILLEGDTQNIAEGELTTYAGIMKATSYEARARLITDRRTIWTDWRPFTTANAGFTWLDFEAEVRAAVDDAMAQAEAAGEAASEANAKADELRIDLDAAVLDLGGDIEDIEQLALDNLNVARAYTDTSVLAEAAIRQTATDALATQIQTLTAVLNSENYIENPRFSDGFTGWSGQTGAATVVAQDDLSGDPIIANAPTAQFASLPAASGAARDLYQDFAVEWLETEVFQWRCHAAVAESGREARAVIEWYDDLGALIGAAVQVTLTLVEDEWRVFSGQHTPPSGAVSVRFRLRVPANASTVPVAFADVSFTKVDQSAIARITDLETVVANNQAAFTLHRDTAESRLDDAEAAITSEQATRATADSALSNRVTTVEADVGGLEAAVSTQSTAISNLEGNAQAGYLIRAQAGGAVSLIDLIAADGDGPPTSIIKMAADDVLISGSVGMEMLTLVDLSGNMVPDADMVSAGAWTGGGDADWLMYSPQNFNWGVGESAGEIRYIGPALTLRGRRSREFSVLQGVEYTMSGVIRPVGGTGLARAQIGVGWVDNNGDVLSRDWIVAINATSGYAKTARSLTAPVGARRAFVELTVWADNEVPVGFSSVSCLRKRAGSTLLQPGSVTSDLVTAATVRALLGQFASLEAANIRVGNGEIDTVKIAAAAITRAKIGDAAVDTLKIANRSITAPYFATRAAEQVLESASTWETIVSLSINPALTGSDIMIIASWFAFAGTFTQHQGSSGSADYDRTVSLRLLWGGTVIATWTNTAENTARTEMDALIDVPPGAKNLVLQGRGGTFGNPSYSRRTSSVRGVNLFALELKR